MASFGRRPTKTQSADGGRRAAPQVSIGRESKGGSEAFLSMMRETEEREQLLREHEEREREGPASRQKDPTPATSSSTRSSSRAGRQQDVPNPRVFLQIEIRGKLNGKLQASGRLEFELFADSVPKTSENFRCLVTGEKGRDLSFANCMFHSIIPGLMAQGGDITAGDGSGGRSIYGDTFRDEGFSQRHDSRGVLSMANTGPNSNNSQFQLMFERAAHLDKKHVVFGRLIHDEQDILEEIEQAGSKSGVPKSMVSIVECGEIGGESISSSRRSRSRSEKLPRRVQYSREGLVNYKSTRHKIYGSFSGIGSGRSR